MVPSYTGNFDDPTAEGFFLCLYGRIYGAYSMRSPDSGNAMETVRLTGEESAWKMKNSKPILLERFGKRY